MSGNSYSTEQEEEEEIKGLEPVGLVRSGSRFYKLETDPNVGWESTRFDIHHLYKL